MIVSTSFAVMSCHVVLCRVPTPLSVRTLFLFPSDEEENWSESTAQHSKRKERKGMPFFDRRKMVEVS